MEGRPEEHPTECGAWIREGTRAWVCIVGDSFWTGSLISGEAGVPVPTAEPPAPCHSKVHLMHKYGMGPLSCHDLPSRSMAPPMLHPPLLSGIGV